ncbi:MAG: hypothetical protein MMC33_010883 [Icmadophila ericetorum]|nr:hypothetical protein [Icmadophila ericetorum]
MAKHGAHSLPGLQSRPHLKELVLVLGIRLDIRLQLLVPDERHVRGEHHQALSAGICNLASMHTCNFADHCAAHCNLEYSAALGSQEPGTEADAMGSAPLLLHQQAEVLAAEGGGAEAPGPIKARPVPVAPAQYTPGFTSEAHASTAAA